MSPILGVTASSILLSKQTSFQSIATATVDSGGASSITFSSIPSTYTHLQLRCLGMNNGNYWMQFQANGVTSSSNYTGHRLQGDGSSITADYLGVYSTSFMYGSLSPASSIGGNACIVDILDYTNTSKYKTFRFLGGDDKNGGGYVGLISGLFLSTSAISSLTIYLSSSASFQQYSQFALYGVK